MYSILSVFHTESQRFILRGPACLRSGVYRADAIEDNDEPPTDEQLNHMLARTEEELLRFAEIDRASAQASYVGHA